MSGACTCSRFVKAGAPCRDAAEDGASLCLVCRDGDCEIEAAFGGPWQHVAPVGKPPEKPLSSLPEYTCGQCGETFGSNCALDDIRCVECGAIRCPHCEKWFGGES